MSLPDFSMYFMVRHALYAAQDAMHGG